MPGSGRCARPEICPLHSAVRLGHRWEYDYRAKPPSSSLPVPEGRHGRLVALQANPRALRSYNRDIKTLFGGSISSIEEVRRLVGGNIVVMLGFGNPALASLIEEWGGAGLIAVNPGMDIHWGTCTTIWGSPDLRGSVAQAEDPGRRGEQPRRTETACARRATAASATIRTEMQEGWFMQKIPVVTFPGAQEPDKFVLVHGHYDSGTSA